MTIFDISYSMIALLLLIVRVFVSIISLNDDGFAHQRSGERLVLYVQVKSHTFLLNNIINDLCTIDDLLIIYYLPLIIYLSNAHTKRSPTPPS